MQIGLYYAAEDVAETEATFRSADADGLDSVWVTQAFGTDTLSMIGALARTTTRLRLGTAVIPSYPRHPMVLAQQALTTNLLLGGRLALGVGPSHRNVVEPCWGMSYDRPVRHTREYLEALTGALVQHVRFRGEVITARGDLEITGATPPPVLLSAIGPQMVKAAGSLANGTITWMVGPRTLETELVPGIREAAAAADRSEPEVVVPQPICLTHDVGRARALAAENLAWYGTLPSYQAVLAREGFDAPEDVALIGSREQLLDALGRYRDIGVTTIAGQVFGGDAEEIAATRALLGELARSRELG
jgi:5,10-methylenetetrahydromethanopterin reductase